MDFPAAREKFVELLESIDDGALPAFLDWITQSYGTNGLGDGSHKSKAIQRANKRIAGIADHLKQRLPQSAILPTEQIAYPRTGYDSDCNEKNTLHVDNFLFDDDDVEKLVEEGKLTRAYCCECGSKDTKSLTFISHSLSREQVEFMFTKLVPLSKKKLTVLDIGSRLGGVLYGASLFGGEGTKAVGIEINEELVKIQKDVVEKFSIPNIDVICADLRTQADVVRTADVVVMNNVFNFFMSEDEQLACWEFLHDNLKKGCVVLHNPDLRDVVAHLPLSFKIEEWLVEKNIKSMAVDFCGSDEGVLYDDCCQMRMYKVI